MFLKVILNEANKLENCQDVQRVGKLLGNFYTIIIIIIIYKSVASKALIVLKFDEGKQPRE